jgi:hypothetical protein
MGRDRQQLSTSQAPFHTLIKLIEHELELAGQGRLQELQLAVQRTGEHLQTLPTPAPEAAMGLVLRAQALRGRVTIEVTRLSESIAASRARIRRGRELSRQYGNRPSRGYSTTA